MNNKQTLLQSPQIDAVRDKTLSFGCEFELSWDSCGVGISPEDYPAGSERIMWDTHKDEMCHYEVGDITRSDIEAGLSNKENYCPDLEMYVKIIGHPLTHADLLRALPTQYNIRHGGNKILITVMETTVFNIPLTYRHLEDIPEDDPCWEQLCRVFNLV